MTVEYGGRTGSTGGRSYQKMEQEVAETGHKYQICRLFPGLRGGLPSLLKGTGEGPLGDILERQQQRQADGEVSAAGRGRR